MAESNTSRKSARSAARAVVRAVSWRRDGGICVAIRLGSGMIGRAVWLTHISSRSIGVILSRPSTVLTQRLPTPASDSEIAADFLVVEHVRLFGGVAHLFDRDRVEIGEKGFARSAYSRIDHPLKQHRV
jgi:hypothetical protein